MKRRCSVRGVEEYGVSHRPADAESGAPLHDLTGGGRIYPADVYDKPSWYDTGDSEYMEAWSIASSSRGKPDRRVGIYRALPCGQKTFHRGDWVSITRKYARGHGKHRDDPSKDLCVIWTRVPAKCLHTSGDSLLEWGYNCDDVKARSVVFRPRRRK